MRQVFKRARRIEGKPDTLQTLKGNKMNHGTTNYYPPIYHKACHHLVAFGAHGGDRHRGRLLIARALKALRSQHGRDKARHERQHMLFISGIFPEKP
jgi:hypothetical protein